MIIAVKRWDSSIWPMNGSVICTATPGQIEPGSNGNNVAFLYYPKTPGLEPRHAF